MYVQWNNESKKIIYFFIDSYMRTLTPVEFDELTKNNSDFLLFCCGTDCNKCRMLEPELEKIEWKASIPFYKIDCQEELWAAKRFDITVLPTIIKMHGSEEYQRIQEVQPWDFILDHFEIRDE